MEPHKVWVFSESLGRGGKKKDKSGQTHCMKFLKV